MPAQIAADRVEHITFEDIDIVSSLNGGIRVSDMPGDVTIRKVRWVVPMMFRVDYRFRDHGARWRDGHHWWLQRRHLLQSGGGQRSARGQR